MCKKTAINAEKPLRRDVFSLLIKNGTIIDGSGKPPFKADVGIRGDKITTIKENLPDHSAPKSIDASGAIVCPGFIDFHSHDDLQILRDLSLKLR